MSVLSGNSRWMPKVIVLFAPGRQLLSRNEMFEPAGELTYKKKGKAFCPPPLNAPIQRAEA
jgi:hypothetical protein